MAIERWLKRGLECEKRVACRTYLKKFCVSGENITKIKIYQKFPKFKNL